MKRTLLIILLLVFSGFAFSQDYGDINQIEHQQMIDDLGSAKREALKRKAERLKSLNKRDSLFKERQDTLLIPYCKKGLWGWCDTSGNIIIQPNFEEVSFFIKEQGTDESYKATIKTKVGENCYILNKGLIVPKKVGIVSFISSVNLLDKRKWCIVKNSAGKFGIYETNHTKYSLKPEWDTIIQFHDLESTVYLRHARKETLVGYNLLSDSLFETDIVSSYMTMFDDPATTEQHLTDILIFAHKNGELTRIKNGQQTLVTKEEQARFFTSEDFFVAGEGVVYRPKSTALPNPYNVLLATPEDKMVDSTNGVVICYLNGAVVDYKYKDYAYKVVKRENKIGVIAPDGRQIVPTSFDKLEFRNKEKDIILYKNGRMGIKLLNSPFSLIDAKYDSIKPSLTLRTNSSKNFQLFEVILDKHTFFIGENGVEYFKL